MRAVLLLLLVLLVLPALAAPPASGIVNVRDFGATGDGSADDTEAIRAAMKAAAICISTPSPVGTYYQAGPTLLFPAGLYRISDDIPLMAVDVRGEGQAAIQQTNPEKAALVSKGAWQHRIANLTFLGGRSGIDLYNPNIDTGQIIIDRCRFYGTKGPAVYTNVCSTSVEISDCTFIMCAQAWVNERCDQAIMRDCWITSDKAMQDKAVIEHRGARLTIENLIGVPLTGGARQRWIGNYGVELTCRQCRFGGEGGGFTPVYNFCKYPAGHIVLDDCYAAANASFNANCAVYCREVPAVIRVRDCELQGGVGIMVDPAIDLKKYFVNVNPVLLSYTVEGCQGEFLGEVPAGLRKPVVRTVPTGEKMLSVKEVKAALVQIRGDLAKESTEAAPAEANGHTQRTAPGSYVDLVWSLDGYMDATSQKLSDRLALGTAGDDTVILYRKGNKGAWPHVILRTTVDLDQHPWLTWRQKPGTAPGSFAVKVIDLDSGNMYALYGETFGGAYDYHAENLKKLMGGGMRRLQVQYYPLGWGMESAVESSYFWAEPGQYVVMDFFRMEAE
jgi:hypothetical protein